jgi:hypothetical protein
VRKRTAIWDDSAPLSPNDKINVTSTLFDVDLVSVDGSFLPVRDLVSLLSDSPVLDLEAAAAAFRSGGAS